MGPGSMRRPMVGVMGLMGLRLMGLRLMGFRLMGPGSMRRPMAGVMGLGSGGSATDTTWGDPLFQFVDQQLNFVF